MPCLILGFIVLDASTYIYTAEQIWLVVPGWVTNSATTDQPTLVHSHPQKNNARLHFAVLYVAFSMAIVLLYFGSNSFASAPAPYGPVPLLHVVLLHVAVF